MSPTHGRTRQDTCVSEDPTHSGGIVINLGLPTAVLSLLPQDINIGPNSNGLPGISQLKNIVGATMTVGLILAVLALIVSAVVWALGANSSNPHLAGRGKFGVLVGLGAAIITGASVALVNFFWNVGQSV
jgi:hypothetical protein